MLAACLQSYEEVVQDNLVCDERSFKGGILLNLSSAKNEHGVRERLVKQIHSIYQEWPFPDKQMISKRGLNKIWLCNQ